MAWAGRAPMVVKLAVGVQGGPAGKGHQGAAAFAVYVATREGVQRVADEPAPDPVIHARYLSERPGSTGLFGPDAVEPPDLEATQNGIREAAWWHSWVVSMRGPDAEAVGLAAPADWRAMVRRAMPRVSTAMGLAPHDLAWVGAVHRKADRDGVAQPHVHVLVWPVTDRAAAMQPRLPKGRLRACRKVWAREVFGAQRAVWAAERTAKRDAVLARARDALSREPLEAGLAERLEALAAAMPGGGRVALAYMPPAVKRLAREAAEWLLGRAEFAADVEQVERLAEAVAGLRAGMAEGEAAGRRARADLRDRVAQVLLRAAAVRPPEEVRRSLGQVVAWARGGTVSPGYVGRVRRLVGRVVDGAERVEAVRRALGGGPRAAVAAALLVRRERLRRLRPGDAVAERLGAAWPDDLGRYEADRLLRAGGPRDLEALVERLRALAPSASEARVRRAVALEAARARQQAWRSRELGLRVAGIVEAVRRAIEEARAEAEAVMER